MFSHQGIVPNAPWPLYEVFWKENNPRQQFYTLKDTDKEWRKTYWGLFKTKRKWSQGIHLGISRDEIINEGRNLSVVSVRMYDHRLMSGCSLVLTSHPLSLTELCWTAGLVCAILGFVFEWAWKICLLYNQVTLCVLCRCLFGVDSWSSDDTGYKASCFLIFSLVSDSLLSPGPEDNPEPTSAAQNGQLRV